MRRPLVGKVLASFKKFPYFFRTGKEKIFLTACRLLINMVHRREFEVMNMKYIIYLIYPLMAGVLFWGAKTAKRGEWNEEAFSLRLRSDVFEPDRYNLLR